MIRDRESGWPEEMQQLRQGRDLEDRGEPHPGEAFGRSADSHPGGLMSFYPYVRLSFPKTWSVLGALSGPKGCAPGPRRIPRERVWGLRSVVSPGKRRAPGGTPIRSLMLLPASLHLLRPSLTSGMG